MSCKLSAMISHLFCFVNRLQIPDSISVKLWKSYAPSLGWILSWGLTVWVLQLILLLCCQGAVTFFRKVGPLHLCSGARSGIPAQALVVAVALNDPSVLIELLENHFLFPVPLQSGQRTSTSPITPAAGTSFITFPVPSHVSQLAISILLRIS